MDLLIHKKKDKNWFRMILLFFFFTKSYVYVFFSPEKMNLKSSKSIEFINEFNNF